MASGKTTNKPKKEISGLVKSYLIAYNFIETVGWAYLFYLLVGHYLSDSATKSLYETVKWPLNIFQNAAVLEVVHAATRIVSSNPFLTAVQVGSRIILVCGALVPAQAAQVTIGLPLALAAWCVTEVIRYANYTFNLAGGVPHVITWLRYSAFIILYPLGITGELLCLFAAQKEMGRSKLWSIELPNAVNFTFSYQLFLWGVMLSYIPLFPQLYLHMLTLRSKVLGGGQHKKEK